ncbi:hypothetical protein VB715_07980 [Crocosphaera sp. UHCC 0190]|uniref:hypothetical protein n=1 Tax=Crocosphaera sp. UHCC 0190 TaxID=3110246 RepID=UPI002B2125B6|nr:hypothetical protein [Crocosphaera sp. UHCC 0190]MEA5509700.1 hypothetical protein [Crocosphaera sp. UHCC 0190]
MSQTPITVTYSLEEILKEINGKLDTLQKDVNDLKIGQVRLEEKLTGEIKALDIEVKGINKRLDSQEFINRSVAVGFILAIGTGIIKLFFPNFPNLPH